MQSGSFSLDPRRSLAAGALWLIVALAVAFSAAAGIWVGRIARRNVVEQHVRRLSLETDQLSSDLGQALASRLDAVHAGGLLLQAAAAPADRLHAFFAELSAAYPEVEWIAVADADGRVTDAREALRAGDDVSSSEWFRAGARGPWLGVIDPRARRAAPTGSEPAPSGVGALGDVAMPVRDRDGTRLGVVAAHLRPRHASGRALRLTEESGPHGPAKAFVLDRQRMVLAGPAEFRGRTWPGKTYGTQPVDFEHGEQGDGAPRFERLPGAEVLVASAPVDVGKAADLGWQVLLSEPRERVYQRANAVALSILEVSLCLGAATCLLGAAGALHLTRRLQRLTHSVEAAGRDEQARIEIPGGADEVARLALAFDRVHADLKRERAELRALSSELERRVAIRTREVERLAEESRYAAIVRERLKMARDLHDTLAHSMMAMLSEIRFMRRLQTRDPAALPKELAHAEEVAREGLNEARSAITQMRAGTVRESGLGPALSSLFDRFIDRTGAAGEYQADSEAARFGDARAETLLQMAQEGLRNIERHARATRVRMTLHIVEGHRLELSIEDDGVGFDPRTPAPGHFGLVGLREQAQMIGADVSVDSAPGRGTALTVSVDLSPIAFAGA